MAKKAAAMCEIQNISIPDTIQEDMEAGDEEVDDSGDSLSCSDTGEGVKERVKGEKQKFSIGGDEVKSNTSSDNDDLPFGPRNI